MAIMLACQECPLAPRAAFRLAFLPPDFFKFTFSNFTSPDLDILVTLAANFDYLYAVEILAELGQPCEQTWFYH